MLSQILQISSLDLLLSGDEAVLIALACRALPSWRQKLLGAIAGAAVAVALHMILSGGIALTPVLPPGLIHIELIAAILLIWIAVKLLANAPGELRHAVVLMAIGNLFLQIVRADNALAVAAAAQGRISVLLPAIVFTLPFVAAGAALLLALLASKGLRLWAAIALGLLIALEFGLVRTFNIPLIVVAAVLVLELAGLPILVCAMAAQFGWIAGEIAVDEPLVGQRLVAAGVTSWMTALAGAAIVVLAGWLVGRARVRPGGAG